MSEMCSSVVPNPLRLLAVWPENGTQLLRRSFAGLLRTRRLSLSSIALSELGDSLQVPGAYHLLVIPADDFERLAPALRQRCGKRVNLLVLLPGGVERAAAEAWLPLAPAGIAFPADPGSAAAADFLARLCAALLAGEGLYPAVTAAWQGTLPGQSALLGQGAPFLYLSAPDGCIWPQAPKPDLLPNRTPEPVRPTPKGSSIPVYIEQAFFGPTSLGDQVNVIRSTDSPAQAQFTSGGDQINIIHSHPSPQAQQPGAGECSRSLQDASPGSATCPYCKHPLQAAERYCSHCGAQILRSDPENI